jgi:hypothetical protein
VAVSPLLATRYSQRTMLAGHDSIAMSVAAGILYVAAGLDLILAAARDAHDGICRLRCWKRLLVDS